VYHPRRSPDWLYQIVARIFPRYISRTGFRFASISNSSIVFAIDDIPCVHQTRLLLAIVILTTASKLDCPEATLKPTQNLSSTSTPLRRDLFKLVTSSESAGCVQKNVRSTFGDSDPLPVVFPCSRARSDETHDEGVVTFEISFLVWFRNWTCASALIVTIELLLNVRFHGSNE